MSHNIIVEGGTSVKLPTQGKYCDRDIIITATRGGITPEGEIEISKNGVHDVTQYAKVNVNVPIPDSYVQPEGALVIEENGNYDVREYAGVIVNVEASGGGDEIAGAIVDRTITDFSSGNATKIGDYAFRGCKSLKTVIAPNAKSVGEYAFYQCNNLRSIVLPSVTTVSTNSFRDAQYLEKVDLPKLTAIASNTFYGCRGLKTLILRSSKKVTLNNANAFTSCYRMLGTTNSGFNPNGERLGFVYVPKALIEEYQADSVWITNLEPNQFKAIEDYPDICG